jgi:acetyl-CoA carboxylase, biotin carboxylase subunit
VDLVKEQIKVAQGEKLSFSQADLQIRGHAIEVRVCAEDPKNNFLPDIGTLKTYKRPQGAGVRVDDGMEEGMTIPIYYDPMIAKLIAYGKDRNEAIERMKRAITEFQITGIETTLSFCTFALDHEVFRSGKFDTNFIKKYYTPEMLNQETSEAENTVAMLLAVHLYENKKQINTQNTASQPPQSKWRKNRV